MHRVTISESGFGDTYTFERHRVSSDEVQARDWYDAAVSNGENVTWDFILSR